MSGFGIGWIGISDFSLNMPKRRTNARVWAQPDNYIIASYHCFDNAFNFRCFFKVVEFVCHDSPCCGFHEQFRVVIFICKKCVKRKADVGAFGFNFLIADLEDVDF